MNIWTTKLPELSCRPFKTLITWLFRSSRHSAMESPHGGVRGWNGCNASDGVKVPAINGVGIGSTSLAGCTLMEM